MMEPFFGAVFACSHAVSVCTDVLLARVVCTLYVELYLVQIDGDKLQEQKAKDRQAETK
jgi:hypothetical protein